MSLCLELYDWLHACAGKLFLNRNESGCSFFLFVEELLGDQPATLILSNVQLTHSYTSAPRHPNHPPSLSSTYTHSPGMEQFPFTSLQPFRQIAEDRHTNRSNISYQSNNITYVKYGLLISHHSYVNLSVNKKIYCCLKMFKVTVC